ncbi:MAG TPA: SusC/RagA family TonB-linked outer membrane protein [Chryseosolibacter sp.]
MVQITLAMVFSGVVLAHSNHAQEVLNREVTVRLNDVTLREVLNELEMATKAKFVFSSTRLKLNDVVTLVAVNRKLGDVLHDLLIPRKIDYSAQNGNDYIVLMEHRENTAELVPIQAATDVNAFQSIVVSGTVTDADNQSLPGVNIIIKGTVQGTVTDVDGKYRIDVGSRDAILVFSYVGYLSQEVAVGEQTELDVVMMADVTSLDEVVIVALGIEREAKAIPYNVQQISGEEVTNVTDANFVNSLYGKVAGATINASSAGVGGATRVVLRGLKSISGNNNALFVVDGIPMPSLSTDQPQDIFSGAGQTGDGMSNINPDDIESISVLSGPAAAALYGSAAANGVVLITTKKGNREKLSVSISNSTMFSSPLMLPKFQNTYGQSEAGGYYSWGEKLSTPSMYDPADFFQTGLNITNTVSLSTGTDQSQTYISLGSVNASGIVPSNDYERYNLSFRNASKILRDRATLDIGFMGSNVNEQNMVAQGQYFNPLVAAYLFPPSDDFSKVQIFERYNAARNFKTQFWPYGDQGLAMQNPYWVTEGAKFENFKERYMTNASLKYDLASWANVTGRIKMDKSNHKYERKYKASTSQLFASENGYYSLNHTDTRQIYGDVLLNLDRSFSDNTLTLLGNVGGSFEDAVFNSDIFGGKLYDNGVANLFTFANINRLTSEPRQEGYHKIKQSVFGSAQFGYQGMVYLDVSFRNDWASTLAGTNSSSMFYPAIGLSGLVSEIFDFSSDLVPYLKLRVSYSEVGNEPGLFQTIATYPINDGSPRTQTRMFNPNLEPERTKSWEAGINLGVFQNKLKVDATVYQSSTYNQFFQPTLPASSGFTSVIVNAGQVDNKGLELSARYTEEIGKFNWTSYVTYALNRNKIVALLPEWTNPVTNEVISLRELDMGGTGSYKTMLREGGSMGDIFVNTLLADEHGAIYVHPSDQVVVPDVNNFVYAGNASPKYNLGWGNNLTWDRLSLGFLFTARVGGVVVSNTQAIMDAFGVSEASAVARDLGGALVNGKRIPAREYYQTVGGGASGGIGANYVYSATNARLAELTFGYDVPTTLFGGGIKGLHVAFVGRNLFMLYSRAPFDPEITANTGTYFQGIDYFMMPSLRNLGFSVKLKL